MHPPTPYECHGYDIKLFDGETPVLEIWGMWSTPSFSLLLGHLWPGLVATDRVISLGQTEQTGIFRALHVHVEFGTSSISLVPGTGP